MASRVIGASIAREDASRYGQAWFVRPVSLQCVATGKSHARVTAWCSRPDGADLSCEAIRAGVAARWDKYDRAGHLSGCGRMALRTYLGRLFAPREGSAR